MRRAQDPWLTFLNFSGGRQSAMLAEAVLDGEIEPPPHFHIIFADPGMERWGTYEKVAEVESRARDAGIPFHRAEGPNLVSDLVDLTPSSTRADNPPYWVLKENGDVGQLSHKCTRQYKIRPMDRMVRKLLWDVWSVPVRSRPPIGSVCRWIGFGADEQHRADALRMEQAYQVARFPLIEAGMSRADVDQWFADRGKPLPPSSACTACFGHGLRTLKEIHDSDPEGWRRAVAVDEAVRDNVPGASGGQVFVSRACLPLTELAEINFDPIAVMQRRHGGAEPGPAGDDDDYVCDSGACFV